jgi:hypothetical protein
VLVGGGRDDVVDGGGSSSLPQKPGAGKKTSRQIWESGDTGLYQRTRSKSVRTKKQKNEQISRQTTNKFDLWGHSTWPISCHNTTRVNSAVHLPIRDQFTFSNTTPDCFCTITSPVIIVYFFRPEVTIVISPFSAVFFIAKFLANFVVFT